MINDRKKLRLVLEHDAVANNRAGVKARFLGDEIWKWIVCYRKMDFFMSASKKTLLDRIESIVIKYRFHKLSVLLGYSMPIGKIGPGLSIAHIGTIVINGDTNIGKNCRIHEGVTIGTTNGSNAAPQIGDNVFIGDVLATFYGCDKAKVEEALEEAESIYTVSNDVPEVPVLIKRTIR